MDKWMVRDPQIGGQPLSHSVVSRFCAKRGPGQVIFIWLRRPRGPQCVLCPKLLPGAKPRGVRSWMCDQDLAVVTVSLLGGGCHGSSPLLSATTVRLSCRYERPICHICVPHLCATPVWQVDTAVALASEAPRGQHSSNATPSNAPPPFDIRYPAATVCSVVCLGAAPHFHTRRLHGLNPACARRTLRRRTPWTARARQLSPAAPF